MSERPDGRAAAAGLGVALVGGAVLLFLAPDLAGSVGLEAVAETRSLADGGHRTFWLVAVGICGLAWVLHTRDADGDHEALPDHTRQLGGEGGVPTVGRAFDDDVQAAADAAAAGANYDDARETLRSMAVEAVADADGCARDVAAERVRQGAWTDDRVAAAYLSTREATPTRWRLRAWFRPRRTRIDRIRRTVAAIEARTDGRDR